MNPNPDPLVIDPPWLEDRRPGAPPDTLVPVSVVRGFPLARLAELEAAWGPARDTLAADAHAAGDPIENAHWDWQNKALYREGHHCLITVEFEGVVQGITAVQTRLRPSLLAPDAWTLYVDFLEVAPWNRREPPDRNRAAIQTARFGGVGSLLIGEAIRLSLASSAGGRVGLHSLPAAEGFYGNYCGMTRVGLTSDYESLVYFEYAEGVAAGWLAHMGYTA